MSNRDILVVGASAGGNRGDVYHFACSPARFAGCDFYRCPHLPDQPGLSSGDLFRRGLARASPARNHQKYARGRNLRRTSRSSPAAAGERTDAGDPRAKENRARPAVDPLFRSAALVFGPRVIGVVLSGGLDDGTAGLRAIKLCGGLAVVQDPADALVASMPASALRNVTIDHCKPAAELAPLLVELMRSAPAQAPTLDPRLGRELQFEVAVATHSLLQGVTRLGEPAYLPARGIHQTLLQLQGNTPVRFRCHTGHAFTAESLLAELNEASEDAIWNAVRSLQERAMLMQHLAGHWQHVDAATAAELGQQAQVAAQRAELIRRLATDQDQDINQEPA